MKCYKCGSERTVKNGKSPIGRQKYRCKECEAILTEGRRYERYSPEEESLIERMYEEGLGFEAIARILKRSATGVMKNLKKNSINMQNTSLIG
jgi:transposase-like protein